jgi:dissimilatory sulfite reductase (desulfoviridin) alpha/beta subunit
MNLQENDRKVKSSFDTVLKENMLSAAARDVNPWLRGHGGELASKLMALHPDLGRHVSQEIALQNDGWMTADGLFLLAELSEARGPGLIEFSGPEKTAKLLVLDPEKKDLPWNGLRRSGLSQPGSQIGPGCCPFWGPCLGRRSYIAEAVIELATEIEPNISAGFRVELAGCPTDCRLAVAKADLAVVLEAETSGFVIWLGGRHRPFRDQVLPRPWLRQDISDVRELIALVNNFHDLWASLAMGPETLPELVVRLGLDRLEARIAMGTTSKRKRRPGPTPINDHN